MFDIFVPISQNSFAMHSTQCWTRIGMKVRSSSIDFEDFYLYYCLYNRVQKLLLMSSYLHIISTAGVSSGNLYCILCGLIAHYCLTVKHDSLIEESRSLHFHLLIHRICFQSCLPSFSHLSHSTFANWSRTRAA